MIREEAIRLEFRYAAGRAGSAFLSALRDDGLLLGSRCGACDHVVCPARPFCGRCGADTPDRLPVGPAGALVAWTESPDRGALGLVRLDGADGATLHRLIGGSGWAVGDRVKARLAPERTASILAIAGFEPEHGGSR